ncbi:MAG: PKD domain-containing protein [Prolixibacteraceae bacterium]|nr:PKD domain-containing protein [Prolixibacteraceae bacterium]
MKNAGFRKVHFFLFYLLLFLSLIFSCKQTDPWDDPNDDPNNVGEKVAEQSVPASGGSVVVNAPGNPVDGMIIKVPAGSYSQSRDFDIYTVEITSHDLGDFFNPITPLIIIENGGGYADSLMEVTIPITLPSGHIPLGFYYDDVDGVLEAIPVHNYSSSSITLLTRHFSPAADLKSGSTKSEKSTESTCNMVVSSISESLLQNQTIISSGFKVGVDNWEFVNRGSIIAPGGHCAGQNMAAMWYYYEKKLNGEAPLFNRFSTIDALWQDNAVGYRFCSVLQNDLANEGLVINFFDKYIDKDQALDPIKFMTLAGAMLVTGEPQGVGIYKAEGKRNDGSTIYSGHDLICHKISMTEKKLYICDPNHPGTERSISMKNDRFEPVPIALSGEQPENMFPFVTWYAKTAWIEWNLVEKRYDELLAGTIGTVSPNTFPAYSIKVIGDLTHQKENIYSTSNDTLTFYVECPTAELFYTGTDPRRIGLNIFDDNGQKVSVLTSKGEVYTILKPGANKLGFYVFGFGQYKNAKGETVNYPVYVNYEPITIELGALKFDPNPVTGTAGEQTVVTVVSSGDLPADPKYTWDFGDGTGTYQSTSGSVYYTWANPGTYPITVNLYDNAKGNLVGSANGTAIIDGSTGTGLSILPNSVSGTANQSLTFNTTFSGSSPVFSNYVWDFGDGNQEETHLNTISHTYTQAGTYSVTARLYDYTSGELLGTATGTAVVGDAAGLLSALYQFRNIRFAISAQVKTTVEDYTDNNFAISNEIPLSGLPEYSIEWSGASFQVNYDWSYTSFGSNEPVHLTGTYNGTLSADGRTITALEAEETKTYTQENEVYYRKATVTNIPVEPWTTPESEDIEFKVNGSSIGSNISYYETREEYKSYLTGEREVVSSVAIRYDEWSEIVIRFYNY